MQSRSGFCLRVLVCLLALSFSSLAQQNAGSIRGVVQDSQGAVVPNVKVSLENQTQRSAAGEVTTNAEGAFLFTGLFASTYSVRVQASGFKTYTQNDIALNVGANIGLPPLVLEVGTATETVTVEGSIQQIDTVSATRAGVVSSSQLVDLGSLSRNFTDFLKTVPGAPPDNSTAINGSRSETASFAIDGVTVMDSGNNSNAGNRFNPDAIAEMKVVANGQSAEYGRSSGASITVVTKSGGQSFHGTGYFFKKGEWMNARTFVQNFQDTRKNMNRVRILGGTLSGPVYIPGKLNRNKDKLFFFASLESNRTRGTTTQTLLMPTTLERQGDFSQSKTATGAAVTVIDPTTKAPFSGNVIPSSRWSTWGPKILNYYWKPNQEGPLQQNVAYNDLRQFDSTSPQFDQIYRVDYNLTQNQRFFFRHIRNRSDSHRPCGGLNSGNTLCTSSFDNPTGSWSVSSSLVSILGATMTNEFLFGDSRNYLPVAAPKTGSNYYRSVSGLNIPLLYPKADPLGLIPNIQFFSPATGTPSSTFTGLPYDNENPIINFSDNFTKVAGNHTLKFGIFWENALKNQTINAPVNGNFSFAPDNANPGNTGWGYANALLGNFTTFSQASQLNSNSYRYNNYEWYGQDTWKARSNLTINFGMRFSLMPPAYEENDRIGVFDPASYDPAKAVVLYRPAMNGTVRMAQDPISKNFYPITYIGKIVPGTGDLNNGMKVAGQNGWPRGLFNSRGVQVGPRFGIAWTPAGASGKTVLRTGGGVFFERIQMNPTFQAGSNVIRQDTMYYGNTDTYTSGTVTYSPTVVSSMSKDGKLATTYNYNIGIQRQLPSGMLLDIGYVGSIARHLAYVDPIHGAPMGTAFLPSSIDPTNGSVLPADFLRQYIGYTAGNGSSGAGGMYRWGGTSSYNSLQISLKRRLGKGLQFGANYNWSKALGIQDNSSYGYTQLNPINVRKADYGPSGFDRRHTLVVDYVYDVPSVARKIPFLDNKAGALLLGGWQLSGFTTFSAGAPGMLSYNANGGLISGAALNRQVTGSDDFGPRIVYTCNPKLSSPTISRFVNETCLAPAPKGSLGMDSGKNSFVGPGYNNWDLSLFKKVQLSKERPERYVQLRLELYNAPNHTEWSGYNSTASFASLTSSTITNLPDLSVRQKRFNFGALNATRAARNIQLGAKIYF